MPDRNNGHEGQLPFPMKDGHGNTKIVWVDEALHPILERMDEDLEQSDYAWYHAIDFEVEAQKRFNEDDDTDYGFDPIENIADSRFSPEHRLFQESEEEEFEMGEELKIRHELELTRKAMEKLQPQQRELLRRRETKTQQEIADEDGVRQQAISNREMKIRKRVKAELEKNGIDEAYFARHRR